MFAAAAKSDEKKVAKKRKPSEGSGSGSGEHKVPKKSKPATDGKPKKPKGPPKPLTASRVATQIVNLLVREAKKGVPRTEAEEKVWLKAQIMPRLMALEDAARQKA